jgi:predicted O-methyltransferase YrrM
MDPARVRRLPRYLFAMRLLAHRDIRDFASIWMAHGRRARGWLRLPDAMLLYGLARRGPGHGAIAEIGSACGRSTICLAAGSMAAHREVVTAIDPHTGDAWFLEDEGLPAIDSFAEFSRNIANAGLAPYTNALVSTSDDASVSFRSPIRLLFIDGLHTLTAVRRDIDNWVPRVVSGGVIVFDDYDNKSPGVGVRTAVNELLESGLVRPRLERGFNLVWTVRS